MLSEVDSPQLAGSHATAGTEMMTPTNELEQPQLAGCHGMADTEIMAPTNELEQSQQHVSMAEAVDQERRQEEVHLVEPEAKTKKGKKSKKKSQQEQVLNEESGEPDEIMGTGEKVSK